MAKEQGITVKKDQDFSEWYTQVIEKAELADIRFGVQGFLVHRPYGFQIIRKIYEYLEKEIEDDNHVPFLFPTVVKEENLYLHDIDLRKTSLNEVFAKLTQEK